MIKKYITFINESSSIKGKLFVEDGEEIDWKLVIDISNIWEKYENNTISQMEFNKQYSDYIVSKKDIITKYAGEAFYYELEIISEDLKTTELEKTNSVYEKIYDVCDEYQVLIKTNK